MACHNDGSLRDGKLQIVSNSLYLSPTLSTNFRKQTGKPVSRVVVLFRGQPSLCPNLSKKVNHLYD
jgi:hypothetical protein